MKNFLKIFSCIAAVILLCLLIFISLDRISIRVLNHRRSPIEQQFAITDLRHVFPYVMFKGAAHAESYPGFSEKNGITKSFLNELGYPGEAPVMPKPSDEYRIVVLGGSSVFIGNPPIPRLIQYQFEKKGINNVKVYNFGVISSVSSMELARLVYEVVDYEPDLIVSYSGFNDMDQPFVADPRPGYPFNYFIYESNPILDSDIRQYPAIPLMLYGSNLMRYFFPRYFLKAFTDLQAIRADIQYNSPEWRKTIAHVYIINLIKSKKIAKAFGAEFIAFFQPSLYFKNSVHSKEQKFLAPDRLENSKKIRQEIRAEAAKAHDQEDLTFIDLSDLFRGNPDLVFKDRVHIRHTHRPYVAVQLYEYILKFFPNLRLVQ